MDTGGIFADKGGTGTELTDMVFCGIIRPSKRRARRKLLFPVRFFVHTHITGAMVTDEGCYGFVPVLSERAEKLRPHIRPFGAPSPQGEGKKATKKRIMIHGIHPGS